jgi:hypothetical protein
MEPKNAGMKPARRRRCNIYIEDLASRDGPEPLRRLSARAGGEAPVGVCIGGRRRGDGAAKFSSAGVPTCWPRGVPGKTVAEDVHPEGGRAAAAVGCYHMKDKLLQRAVVEVLKHHL